MARLVGLPGEGATVVTALSRNGDIAAGYSIAQQVSHAFRWTAERAVNLGELSTGAGAEATSISGDGNVIVGGAYEDRGTEAFRWTPTTGMVGLGQLGAAAHCSAATAISQDGTTAVGWGENALGIAEAFRWTADTGLVGLGCLTPQYPLDSFATAVSGDGSVIVGTSTVDQNGTYLPFIWDAARGMRPLQQVLVQDYGLNLAGITLVEVTGISADGSTLVGTGCGPHGAEAWVAVIPEPTTLALCVAAMCWRIRPAQKLPGRKQPGW